MHYSIDLRRKVITALNKGISKAELARTFGLDRKTIYNWSKRADLNPALATHRTRKVQHAKLLQAVQTQPDRRLADYARDLGVSINTIHYQFKRLGIRKKNAAVRRTKVYCTH
jgi:transposase